MRINVLNFLLCVVFAPNISAQSDPITEIQGRLSLYHPEDTTSVHVGKDAGKSQSVNYERRNTFVGCEAGTNNRVGSANTYVGWRAGHSNTTTGDNTFIGVGAGYTNLGGDNTFVGKGAGWNDSLGNNTVAVGYRAGFSGGNRSVFLGYRAGENGTDVTKTLYISNREGDNPLIYGEFDKSLVRFNAEAQVENNSLNLRNLGGSDSNRGVVFSEDEARAFGIIYDGEGFGPSNRMHIREYLDGDTSDVVTFKGNGNVGVGIDNPGVKLDVNGDIRGTTLFCGGTSACSDIRFKKDFTVISSPLKIISQLNGYFHYWRTNEFPKWQFSEGREIGFKAQAVKEILPEVVEEMPDGYLAVDYSKLVPVLVEAIKDLQVLVEQQRYDHQVLLKELKEAKEKSQ